MHFHAWIYQVLCGKTIYDQKKCIWIGFVLIDHSVTLYLETIVFPVHIKQYFDRKKSGGLPLDSKAFGFTENWIKKTLAVPFWENGGQCAAIDLSKCRHRQSSTFPHRFLHWLDSLICKIC